MGGSPFSKFYRERDEKIRRETFDRIVKVLEMRNEGKEIEVISKETRFDVEKIERIVNMIKKPSQ
ncbi:hypothetical protein [Bacillus sp. JJ1562]|uniref:hypothetical protein n=1 Tax=Bacillus sp. JJ1562 TaxID=3122960 RepID=UPI003002EFF0